MMNCWFVLVSVSGHQWIDSVFISDAAAVERKETLTRSIKNCGQEGFVKCWCALATIEDAVLGERKRGSPLANASKKESGS